MRTASIKKACEDSIFTHNDLVNEIKRRIAGDELSAGILERGMELAINDEERKAVLYMVINSNKECKDILGTYLYYSMREK